MRDVIVVGAGPVGLLMAALLAERGLNVSVWEARQESATLSRAIGIHPPSLSVLERLGLADQLVSEGVRIHRGVARSGGRTLGSLSFRGVSKQFPFVLALPQFRTEAMLERRLDELRPGAVRRGITLTGVSVNGELRSTGGGAGPGNGATPGSSASSGRNGGASGGRNGGRSSGRNDGRNGGRSSGRNGGSVTLTGQRADGGEVTERAAFVIGADGPRSTLRRLLGVRVATRQYNDTFVMGDFRDDTDHGSDAVVHLEREGVVESFPLPGGIRRFVVATDALMEGPDAYRVARLIAERTGERADASTNTMLSPFTVRRRFAERVLGPRIALIGDAAHEISPIGGQGMNLGWLDAQALLPIVVATVRRGGVDPERARTYELERGSAVRRAARQAEINMSLGRPGTPLTMAARRIGLSGALRSPASHLLAQIYAMKHI